MIVTPPDGRLVRDHIPVVAGQLQRLLEGVGPITIDMSAVSEVDSAGAALLATFSRQARASQRAFELTGLQQDVAATLELFPFVQDARIEKRTHSLLEQIGDQGANVGNIVRDYLILCADTLWFAITGLFKKRGIRWQQVGYEMSSVGSQAFGVVGLICFLVGGTMALQSAAQLRQFGANIFVVDLIGVSITRELGPLMAAIVVAGRSGSAIAAEIATMVITEEVDAVKTMGLNPTRFLILPKVVAITITQPVLTVLGSVMGILGGFVVAVLYLDLGPTTFLSRLEQAVFLKDVLTGLFKSVVFAQLIVTIGALCGMRTRGGADAVGRSTTTSVVASIFAVIVADAFCSLLFYF